MKKIMTILFLAIGLIPIKAQETPYSIKGTVPKDVKNVFLYTSFGKNAIDSATVVDGKFELLLPDDEQIFAYVRRDDDSQMLICVNFTGKPAECTISGEWKDAQLLIHNYKDGAPEQTGDCLRLRPYEAFILYRKN